MTIASIESNPQTEEDWSEWIANAEQLLREEYLRRPKRLIADYRTEKAMTHGYQGRENLEMPQNAGDAAGKSGIRGRIRIELSRNGVVVANTGQGFDADGVDSLQTPNMNGKFLERRKPSTLISNKDLGFRSILKWTVIPSISSETLRLSELDEQLAAYSYVVVPDCIYDKPDKLSTTPEHLHGICFQFECQRLSERSALATLSDPALPSGPLPIAVAPWRNRGSANSAPRFTLKPRN